MENVKEIDLSTNINGVNMDLCIMNASGCKCTTENELDSLFRSNSGCVVSKSSTIHFREGNCKPRYYSDGTGSINSMGLPNMGYKFYMNYYEKQKCGKPFMQSIFPFNLNEMETMLKDIDKYGGVLGKKLVEVNVSCPNLIGDSIDFENVDLYMDKIKQLNFENLNIGLKLAPIYQLRHYDIMSNLLIKNNIKFITCCNSLVNGLFVDVVEEKTCIYPKDGIGGIGGSYIKPISLSNVYNFHKRLGNKVDIIGCGGVYSGKDVFEYILCGAKAVQVGTCFMNEDIVCFDRLNKDLEIIMKIKEYKNLRDFWGKIKTVERQQYL